MNYKKVYQNLVESRKASPTLGEKHYIHHIVPKAEGGSNDESNLVKFTAREHYIAHLLLAKIYDDKAMWCAVQMMRKKNIRYNSRLFACALEHCEPWNKGRHLTEECKKKISKTLTGRKLSSATRQKMSNAKKGKPPNFTGHRHSEESRRRK